MKRITTSTIPRSMIAATAVAALTFGAVACSDDDDNDDVDNPVDTMDDQVDSIVDEVDSVVDTMDDQVDSIVDESTDETTDE